MLTTTLDAHNALLRTDNTLDAAARKIYGQALRQPPDRLAELLRQATAPPETNIAHVESRVIGRRETAARFGRSLRFVDMLALQGILPKVKLPGRQRACGFREKDVTALIEQGAGAVLGRD